MNSDDASFTLEEALKVQKEMRDVLGLGPEVFPMPAFIGMISDEIEKLRAVGESDDNIASLITRVVGRKVSSQDVCEHYTSLDKRHPAG